MTERAPAAIRPAATVMLVRERAPAYEIYMLRRSARSAFLPEMYVFPGGAVEAGDAAIAQHALLREPQREIDGREQSEPAFEVAALREAFEEAGILLAARRDGSPLALDGESLHLARLALLAREVEFATLLDDFEAALDARRLWHFSHWITPPIETRRFDTHFYLAIAPAEQHGSTDEIETHQGLWIGPADALSRNAAGTFPMIFPTIKHLERLARYPAVAELCTFASEKAIRAVNPNVGDGRFLSIPEELEERW